MVKQAKGCKHRTVPFPRYLKKLIENGHSETTFTELKSMASENHETLPNRLESPVECGVKV